MNPHFDHWEFEARNASYQRRFKGVRAVVGRFDGWNWGFLILGSQGIAIQGQCNSLLDLNDAIHLANATLEAL